MRLACTARLLAVTQPSARLNPCTHALRRHQTRAMAAQDETPAAAPVCVHAATPAELEAARSALEVRRAVQRC